MSSFQKNWIMKVTVFSVFASSSLSIDEKDILVSEHNFSRCWMFVIMHSWMKMLLKEIDDCVKWENLFK